MASLQKTCLLLVTLVIVTANICTVSSWQYNDEVKGTSSDVMLMKILREYETNSHQLHFNIPNSDNKKLLDAYAQGLKMRNDSICSCQGYTCGCCLRLEVEKISLNDTACLNISYLPDEYGFQFEFILNGKVLIDKKISVKNPPPICAAIPYVKHLASLCIRFYNLDFKNNQFSGCADIEAELEGVVVKKFDLGCFKIPPSEKNRSLNGRVGGMADDNRTQPKREGVDFPQFLLKKAVFSHIALNEGGAEVLLKNSLIRQRFAAQFSAGGEKGN